jgi:hypothetical protein
LLAAQVAYRGGDDAIACVPVEQGLGIKRLDRFAERIERGGGGRRHARTFQVVPGRS